MTACWGPPRYFSNMVCPPFSPCLFIRHKRTFLSHHQSQLELQVRIPLTNRDCSPCLYQCHLFCICDTLFNVYDPPIDTCLSTCHNVDSFRNLHRKVWRWRRQILSVVGTVVVKQSIQHLNIDKDLRRTIRLEESLKAPKRATGTGKRTKAKQVLHGTQRAAP